MKREKDEKITFYSHCFDCGFNKFEIIDKEELIGLLYCLNNVVLLFEIQEEYRK